MGRIRNKAGFVLFPLFFLFAAVVLMIYADAGELPMLYKGVTMPEVQTNDHAVARHGSEAEKIRECLPPGSNPHQAWRGMREKDKYYFLCQLPDGRFGFQITRLINGKWQELTAFVRGNGTYVETVKYLGRIATVIKALPES